MAGARRPRAGAATATAGHVRALARGGGATLEPGRGAGRGGVTEGPPRDVLRLARHALKAARREAETRVYGAYATRDVRRSMRWAQSSARAGEAWCAWRRWADVRDALANAVAWAMTAAEVEGIVRLYRPLAAAADAHRALAAWVEATRVP